MMLARAAGFPLYAIAHSRPHERRSATFNFRRERLPPLGTPRRADFVQPDELD